eukprot:GDKI01005778.1.p1 GENE.GDKI01005778.1~~GDKI01005778.1.p1  ORF type:complete len:624 (+),score=154.20 GDKI01005778.1:41-1912(+)
MASLIQATSEPSRFSETYSGIDLKNVNISVENKELLVDAKVQFVNGKHYGLLGRNGVGKSILLTSLASGSLLPVALRTSIRVMLVRQTLDLERISESEKGTHVHTVQDELMQVPYGLNFVMSEREKWQALTEQQSGARGKFAREMLLYYEKMQSGEEDPVALAEQEQMLELEKPDPAHVVKVAKSMKIGDEVLCKPYLSLSGGWRMRVQLAKALIFTPDVLLLDEPTNHLDIAGVEWLQKTLNSKFTETTIVLVSHNRSFLNAVATDMIVFKNKSLEYFKGNYEQYIQTIADKEAFNERAQDAIDRKKEKMADSIQKNMQIAKKTGDDKRLQQTASRKVKMEERIGLERNAKGHRFKLNRDRAGYHYSVYADVDHIEEEKAQPKLHFTIQQPAALPRSGALDLLAVEGVGFKRRANGKTTFEMKNITMSVEGGRRYAIVGANGEGKTSLLNLLAGVLTPSSGTVTKKCGDNAIGYFRQDVVAELGSVQHTPVERLTQMFPNVKMQDVRGRLGAFGLGSTELATQKLSTMSGGQRVAYAFAELTFNAPSVLLLDEPNSHLDLEALELLADSLCEYEGAVVFVSHDLSFIQEVATDAYWMEGGTLTRMELEEVPERAKKTAKAPV